jgi:hypothetical protein
MTKRPTWPRNAVVVSALVWIGMLLGVSFLATPAKFLAPSLDLPVALDVGRQTFRVFSIVEVAASLLLLATAVLVGRARVAVLVAVIVCLVAFQVFWLLPVLDDRVEIILQGGMPEESGLHSLYVVIESAKLLLLGLAAWLAFTATRGRTSSVPPDLQ